MDEFLAGRGYWAAWAAAVSSALLNFDGRPRPLWLGFVLLASIVAWPFALRASALRGALERGGLTQPGWSARIHRTTVRLRWPMAVVYGAVSAVYAQWYVGVPWFTVVAALAAAVAYAARPLPAGTPASA